MRKTGFLPADHASRGLLALFSMAFAAAWQMGRKLHIVSPYDGRMEENYLLPWSARDFAILLLIAALVLLLCCLLLYLRRRGRRTLMTEELHIGRAGSFWLGLGLLMLLWLPYLLRYYPAIVFPDTVQAMREALYEGHLSNRNPVVYTLFIRLCLALGDAFLSGDLTSGCLIYALVQMLLLAAGLSYLCCWIAARGRLGRIGRTLLLLCFGLDPYVGALSIAMWKDPLFSIAAAVWSLQLADLVLPGEPGAQGHGWRLRYLLLTLAVLFWRNNGISAVLCVALGLLLLCLHRKKAKAGAALPALRLTVCAVLLWAITVLPVYKSFGIGMPKEETGGLMLNQMARVAASGESVFDENERAYLDEMLPFEQYPSAYRPCCVDLLKWDDEFNFDALNGSQFQKTWLSLLRKNPRLYAEAWVLETYGFWTMNRAENNLSIKNISYGHRLDGSEESSSFFADKQLSCGDRLPAFLSALPLPLDSLSVPIGPLNWLLLLLAVLLLLSGEGRMLLPLAPSMGIAVGMIACTPISYLPRYELAVQLLFPFFLLLFSFRIEGEGISAREDL